MDDPIEDETETPPEGTIAEEDLEEKDEEEDLDGFQVDEEEETL